SVRTNYSMSVFCVRPTRPALRSTRFPYTTLFRSDPQRLGLAVGEAGELGGADHHQGQRAGEGQADQGARQGHGRADVDPVGQVQDRKSTRLNSSHVKISYAVFCLKKKNIDTVLAF